MFRERLVCEIRVEEAQRKLLSNAKLTLTIAMEITLTREVALCGASKICGKVYSYLAHLVKPKVHDRRSKVRLSKKIVMVVRDYP